MNDQTGKSLVVDFDDALRATLVSMLKDSGYEVSTDYREGIKAVLAFEPDLVVLGADPPQLDCCDLLSEIKGSKHTRKMRVVMLIHGSSAERTRGLDLGADDALRQSLTSRSDPRVKNRALALPTAACFRGTSHAGKPELVKLNEHLTDAEITLAIRYLDPDLCAERTGEDAGTLVGICITLLIGLTSAITCICLYMRSL